MDTSPHYSEENIPDTLPLHGSSSPSQLSVNDSLDSFTVSEDRNEKDDIQTLSPVLPDVVNALRFLSADVIAHAGSGHTGLPLGMAPATTVLWDAHLSFSPLNPEFINRDRFVLSAGHGSALLYSLLYIFGFSHSLSKHDLLNFRRRGSRTPGHPENILTSGVEVTTGALGQGICNAVGLALAETHLAAVYNRPGFAPLIDHFTYCLVGDGCLMEGISAEAASLAGHWKLGKLIVLYDDNSVSIEGSTDLAFTENVSARFAAQHWQVLEVPDGDGDLDRLHEALSLARRDRTRPSLIRVKTTIGFGLPDGISGTNKAHGPCLDPMAIAAAKKAADWNESPLSVPDVVLHHTHRKQDEGLALETAWNDNFHEYRLMFPDVAAQFERCVLNHELPQESLDNLFEDLCTAAGKPTATRKSSGVVLNRLAAKLPGLLGGSADLGPSTATELKLLGEYQSANRSGRNLHFGVREHGMGSICNGIALHGSGLIPFCSTFLAFSDYMRAAIRTAALSHAGVLFVFTHDSVLLGQDGPTHQPVEQLASLRAMPNVMTLRPADDVETAACYEVAVARRDGPSVLALSRQTVDARGGRSTREGTLRGGYVHGRNFDEGMPDVVVISTGSEIGLVYEAIREIGDRTRIQVVSMPCMEAFLNQSLEYRNAVLCVPRECTMVVEAGSSFGWHRFADWTVCVDEFGISAPGDEVRKEVGLTKEAVMLCVAKVEKCSR